MNKNNIYKSPIDASLLKLEVTYQHEKNIIDGIFKDSNNQDIFKIIEGIPDFTYPKSLAQIDEKTRLTYEKLANEYDKYASIPFQTFYSSEFEEREKMTDKLNLNENSIVLEVGAGDGRGAEHIVKRLGKQGKFYVQELSLAFLKKAIQRLKKYELQTQIEYSIASAMYIPFADNSFDAALHFGGMNTFSDQKRFLTEITRVVKPGGKIVIGDESMAPWLRETEMGKIMMNSNPLLKYEIPFDLIPVKARDVKIEWIMLGSFFIIEFTVAESEPVADYHIQIPSDRGGSHWTRYFGNLEGVSIETKELALQAQKKLGVSMHQWLEEIIKREAKKILK